jgi:hypothetical protein
LRGKMIGSGVVDIMQGLVIMSYGRETTGGITAKLWFMYISLGFH